MTPLLEKLEEKIHAAIELIEYLRLQVDELEEKGATLQSENTQIKTRQAQWEQNLATLLRKLESAQLNTFDKNSDTEVERGIESAELEAMV